MLRRLLLLLLLLIPAPLAAQFTPFTAPGGHLYFLRGGSSFFGDASLYLLDSTGARTTLLAAPGHGPVDWYDLGTFAGGEIFGFELFDATTGFSDTDPEVLEGGWYRGSMRLKSEVPFNKGVESIDYLISTTATPEPGAIALLGTGLLGLGAVGWRRRRQGAV